MQGLGTLWKWTITGFSLLCHGRRGATVLNQPRTALIRGVTWGVLAGLLISAAVASVAELGGWPVLLTQFFFLLLGPMLLMSTGAAVTARLVPPPDPDVMLR